MRTTVAALAIVLAIAGLPAAAAGSVLCYGDSITQDSNSPTSYPSQLQLMRPDLQVVNGGQGGDVSWNIERLKTLLAERRYDIVTIMIGTNDPFGRADIMPRETFRNIWKMVRLARKQDAEVILLTQTPATFGVGADIRQRYTRLVAYEMIQRLVGRRARHVHLADLRDVFTRTPWSLCTTDGLHPNAYGSNVIAAFIADAIDALPPS